MVRSASPGGGRLKGAFPVFQPSPTLGCQDSLRWSVVKSNFVSAENFLPSVVGSFVEECFRASLQYLPKCTIRGCRSHLRKCAVPNDRGPCLLRNWDI